VKRYQFIVPDTGGKDAFIQLSAFEGALHLTGRRR
jgi:cold shock CspA family protein